MQIIVYLNLDCNIFFMLLSSFYVGGIAGIMHSQRGNFLMQALLALGLIFAFLPFFASRLASRDIDSQMFASTRQIEIAQTAARIYVRENANALPYDVSVISGDAFSDTLEPYGLPLGFVPYTAMGQDINLVIEKSPEYVSAYLEISGGGLSQLQLAEMARRLGYYAQQSGDVLIVGLALDNEYSDVVRRNEPDVDSNAFLVDLDMGGFSFDNAGRIFARNGEFSSGEFTTLSVNGIEQGRKEKNTIENMFADKTVFQTKTGESALSLTRGELTVGAVNARTVAQFGDTGTFTSNTAAVYDFSMSAGHTSFYGPPNWNINGNVVTENINFNVERIEISSYLNASRAQDVFLSDDLDSISNGGIETDYISASNITMRDQTSDALADGESGPVILDIRPAGTSVLPDILFDGINNDSIAILARPESDESNTMKCETIISRLDGRHRFNQKSLAQYIICQYVYWQRLEHRIDIKRCMMSGGSNCG